MFNLARPEVRHGGTAALHVELDFARCMDRWAYFAYGGAAQRRKADCLMVVLVLQQPLLLLNGSIAHDDYDPGTIDATVAIGAAVSPGWAGDEILRRHAARAADFQTWYEGVIRLFFDDTR